MSDYTPITEEIRHGYSEGHANEAAALGYFDRWFASEIEKAARRARAEFANELTRKGVYSFDIHSIRRYAGEDHREH